MLFRSRRAAPPSRPRPPDPRLLLLAAAVASVAAAAPLSPTAPPPVAPSPPAPCPPDSGAGPALERQLAALAAHLAGPRDTAAPPRPSLPRVYGWIVTPAGRRRVKCLLDSGASHCFLSRALAAQLPPSCRRPPPADHPPSVRQADGSSRPAGGAIAAQLVLGGLDEETAFVEYDVDCDADLILGYEWLRSHGLAFLYDTNEVCICAERDCTSGRRVRLDLTLDGPASPATRLSLAEARDLLGAVGLGPASTLGRPSQWSSPSGGSAAAAAIHEAVAAAGAADTLAGLAETGTTLADGTELFVGRIAFAAEGPAFALPPDDGDPPDFAALAGEYADVLAGPPPGLPPDRGPAFELRIDTGEHPVPRSRQMKRWSLTGRAR